MINSGLKAYTLVPDQPNASYLSNTHFSAAPDPIGGSTIGFLMILSTLQYSAPTMSPTYSTAASKAGNAAFIQSGGQEIQGKLASRVEREAKEIVHDVGISENQVGVVLGAAKIVRDRQVEFNGPKVYFVKTHMSVSPGQGLLGLKVEF